MASKIPEVGEPSLAGLVRAALDQSQVLLRAEVDLLKRQAQTHAVRGIVAFIVALASAVAVVGVIALSVAALVISRGGGSVSALLSAAGASLFVTVVALVSVVFWITSQQEVPDAPDTAHRARAAHNRLASP